MIPRDAPEEEFYVGGTNDAGGVRLKEYDEQRRDRPATLWRLGRFADPDP
jgi:hypothetical protein